MTERTSVLTVKARRSGAPALEARAVLRPAVRRLGAVALGFAGGWAVLYGALMPFGLGLVLGLAEDCFAPCAAGAALGVLLHGFGALSLRSVCLLCALGAAVAVRWVWPGRFLPAVLAGCGTLAAMGLCFALGTGGGAELALFCTADALLAGLLGLALRRFPPEKPGFGTLLTGAAVAAALGNLPLERFFPGVAVCAAVELVLCSRGQPGAALACSGMLGAALCAADPALACAAAGLACGASAACILAPGRRVEAAAAYAGKGYTEAEIGGEGYLKYQAEETALKSSQSIYPQYDRTSPATEPYHVSKIRRNVIGQGNWSAPGQWISYKIKGIPEDGLYYITLKYRQNLMTGQSSFRSIYVNGEIPSTAYENVAFPYGVNWDTMTIVDENGNPCPVYLKAGDDNEIRMEVPIGKWAEHMLCRYAMTLRMIPIMLMYVL